MEDLILCLCGLWFWATRESRVRAYTQAAELLREARAHLADDYAGRASTRDRGVLLPEQVEALALLETHAGLTARNVRRFASLPECCHFVAEELRGPQPFSMPLALPAQDAFAPEAVLSALASLLPDTHSGAPRQTPGTIPAPAQSALAEAA